MKVLIACEFSGTIRQAFEDRGHDAWSCDIVPAIDGKKHYRANVFSVIYNDWDLIIAHPPCTYLSKVQAIHYDYNKWPLETERRTRKRDQAIECIRMAIENPIPLKVVTEKVGMYDQIIQPYQFGDPFTKSTCLWLRGLPRLVPTELVEKGEMVRTKNGTNAKWYHHLAPGENRGRKRSITFPGIARAMAEQWG
jgi:hypothetical protein